MKTGTSKAIPTESSDSMEDEEEKLSTTSEILAPSPKRLNQKKKPLIALFTEPTRKSVRTRQSSLANAFGSPIPINAIKEMKLGSKKKKQFNIKSPTEGTQSPPKTNLKSLIQKIGFSDKTPEYQACMKLLEAISPKNKTRNQEETEIIDLICSG